MMIDTSFPSYLASSSPRYNVVFVASLLFLAHQVLQGNAFSFSSLTPRLTRQGYAGSQSSPPLFLQNPNGREPEETRWSFQDVSFHHLEEEPLTTGSKRRKEVELQLLELLKESDESIDPLIELWSSERQEAVPIFQHMDEFCSPGLKQEETILRQMIDESEMEWAEPMVRLALLLFVKGLYEESTYWCRQALDIKPWHFEGGRLLVVLHLRMGQFGRALQAGRTHLLPALNDRTSNKRRVLWVNEVMSKAMRILKEAEIAASTKRQDENWDECPVVEGSTLCWE